MVAGDVVNTASRLQQIAPVGSVVVGEDTRRATEKMIDYEPMDAGRSSRARPIPSRSGAPPRPESIHRRGRPPDEPVHRSRSRARAPQAGVPADDPRVIGPVGDRNRGAGSREEPAHREFFKFVDAEPGEIVHWRHGRCLPYGDGVTFWALGEIVKAQAGILESDGADDGRLGQAVEPGRRRRGTATGWSRSWPRWSAHAREHGVVGSHRGLPRPGGRSSKRWPPSARSSWSSRTSTGPTTR